MNIKQKISLKSTLLLIIIMGSISGFSQTIKPYPKELAQMRANYEKQFLKDTLDLKEVNILLNTLDKKGAWPGIDYSSKQRGRWQVIEHLQKIQILSRAFLKPKSPFFKTQKVADKIKLGLDYWLKNDFVSPNWWYPQIGIPQALAPILIVMEDELSVHEIQNGIRLLDRSKIGMGGQNKVWLSGNVMLKSLLLRNVDSVAIASKTIQNEIKVSTGLGIQPDYSFHEHGVMLQQGNYGLHYLDDMLEWLPILRNTPFAFDEAKLSILRNYILDGMQWVIYKKSFDIAAAGRHLFKDELVKKRITVLDHLHDLAELDPAYANSYLKATDYKNLIGNKHFWNSDYHVQRSPNYFFSIKMSSSRVSGYETVNDENMLGYHLGSGMTLIYQTDEQYKNIFPFWDWKKLPGTTIIQDKAPIIVSNAWGYKIEGDFVGGVTDGKDGIAVLQYNRGGLKANKSWFMFNDQIVCLGSGITADTNFNVTTSINQSYLNGDLIVSAKDGTAKVSGEKIVENPNWVLHNNIGYIFPDGGDVEIVAKSVTGSWYNVAKRYSDVNEEANIFSLWLNHGKRTKDAKYQYILVPNANESKVKDLVANESFKIINEIDKQIVVANDGKTAGIVFYKAGSANVFGGITVDQPCLVMLKKNGKDLNAFISDPTHKLAQIKLVVKGSFLVEGSSFASGSTSITAMLPKDGLAGKSISINFKAL